MPLLLKECSGEGEQRHWGGKLDMYWRGALALQKMSTAALHTMAERRLHLHDELGLTELGAEGEVVDLGHVTTAPEAEPGA
eukprot:COSAG01_NODE_64588_length_276_cov_0.576271_1_plen_80_part_10